MEIVERLNSDFNALLQLPDIREAFSKQGLNAVVDRPERLGELLDAELARWTNVVSAAAIKAN